MNHDPKPDFSQLTRFGLDSLLGDFIQLDDGPYVRLDDVDALVGGKKSIAKVTSPRRNGCWNLPRPVAGEFSHWAQNGWREVDENWGNVSLHPIWKGIRHVMTTDCQYTKTTPDKACEGCCHQVLKP